MSAASVASDESLVVDAACEVAAVRARFASVRGGRQSTLMAHAVDYHSFRRHNAALYYHSINCNKSMLCPRAKH